MTDDIQLDPLTQKQIQELSTGVFSFIMNMYMIYARVIGKEKAKEVLAEYIASLIEIVSTDIEKENK